MVIDEQLYIGKLKDRQAIKMIKKIKKFKPCAGVFVVTLPIFGDGILEIYNINEFQQKIYKELSDRIHIVGLAVTKRSALYLVKDIINDIYQKTGAVNPGSFFKNTQDII